MIKITKNVFFIAFTLILLLGIYLTITEGRTGGWASGRYGPLEELTFTGPMIILLDILFLAVYLTARKGLKREYKDE